MVRFQSCWCGSTGRWCPPLLKQTKPTICDEENKTHPAHFVAIDRTRPLDCLQLFTSREQSSSFFRILWDSVFAFLSFPFMVIQATLANLSFYIFFSHLHCDHADWKFPFPGFTWYSIFTWYSPSLDLPWELFFSNIRIAFCKKSMNPIHRVSPSADLERDSFLCFPKNSSTDSYSIG